MAKNRFETIFSVVGQDLASPAFARVRKGFGMMGRSSKNASTQLRNTGNAMQQYFLARDIGAGFLRLGKNIVGMFSEATEAAGEFELGLAAVGAVTRATEAEMKKLEKVALKAGIETQFDPAEAVQGLQSLATAGQTVTQSTQTLIPVLDLAAGSLGQLGVEGAAEAVVGTLNSYSMAANEATGVTDKLLRITQLTNFQARDFGVGLSKAAAFGANFDQSLSDVLITMGQLRNRNIDASTSATSLREAFRRLGSDAGAQQAVQKHGVKIFDESTNKMRSAIDIIQDLDSATEKLGVKEKKAMLVKVLGTRGQFAWNAVLGATAKVQKNGNEVTLRGADAIAQLRKEMENATGTAEEMRKKLLETFAGQKKLLGGSLRTFSIAVGKAFTGLLAPATALVIGPLNSLIKLMLALPPTAKKMAAALTIATGVVIGLTGALVMAQAVMKMFGIRLRDIGWMLFKTILFMGPLTILLGALGVGIYGVVRHFNSATEAGNDFAGIVDKVKVGFKGLIDLIASGGLSASTIKELDRIDSQGVRKFLVTADTWIKNMKAFFNGIIDGFDAGLTRLAAPWEKLKQTIGEVFGIWIGGTESGEKGLQKWEVRGQKFGDMMSGLSVLVLEAVDGILKGSVMIGEAFEGVTFEDFLNGLRSIADVVSFIGRMVKGIVNAFGNFGSIIKTLLPSGKMRTIQELGGAVPRMDVEGTGKILGTLLPSGKMTAMQERGGIVPGAGVAEQRRTLPSTRGDLRARESSLREWFTTPPEWWSKTPTAFADATPEMQQKFLDEFKEIRKELEKRGEDVKPINIEIDGQKVMSVLGARGEDRAESDLGLGGASSMFTGI